MICLSVVLRQGKRCNRSSQSPEHATSEHQFRHWLFHFCSSCMLICLRWKSVEDDPRILGPSHVRPEWNSGLLAWAWPNPQLLVIMAFCKEWISEFKKASLSPSLFLSRYPLGCRYPVLKCWNSSYGLAPILASYWHTLGKWQDTA